MSVLSKAKDGSDRVLYAVYVERPFLVGRESVWCLDAEPVYVHAVDAGQARVQACLAAGANARVALAAPAVGFHVHDEHGEKLSA